MPPIQTYVASNPGETSKYIPPATTAIDISGLARGITQLGQGMAQKRENAQKLLEAQEAKRADLWINKQVVEADRFFTKYTMEASANPSTTAADDFDKAFAAYQEEAMKSAPSTEAAEKFSIRLGALGNDHYGKALQLVSSAHAINTVKDIDTMTAAARDSMAMSMDYESLQGAQQYMMAAIENSRGLVFDKVIDEQLKKVQNLSLEAVRMWAPEDPILAKQVLADIKDLPGDVRRRELDNIDKIVTQGRQIDRVQAVNDFKSMVSAVAEQGGDINSAVIEQVVLLSEPNEQASKRLELVTEATLAKDGYRFTQAIRGEPPKRIDELTEEMKPGADVKFHDMKWKLYEQAQQLAEHQKKQIKERPFDVAMQSPAIKPLQDAYDALPDNDPRAPGAFQDLIRANMAIQENSLGVPSYGVMAASPDELKLITERLNKGTSQEIIDGVNQYKSLYGAFYPDLLRNVRDMPNSAGLSPYLLTIMDHIGTLPNGETPGYVHAFIEANRTPVDKLGVDNKFINETGKTLSSGKDSAKLIAAMYATGASNEEVQDLLYGIAKYHGYRVGRGTDNLNEVVAQMVSSQYTLGKANGVSFALPRSLGISDEEVQKDISPMLDSFLDVSENRDGLVTGGTVDETLAARSNYYSGNLLVKSGLVDFLTTQDGARANHLLFVHGKADVNDMLRDNAYWSHMEGTDEMILMANKPGGQVGPVYKGIANKGAPDEKGIPFTVPLKLVKALAFEKEMNARTAFKTKYAVKPE